MHWNSENLANNLSYTYSCFWFTKMVIGQAIGDPILMFFKVKANPPSTKNKFGPKRANNDFDFPLLYTNPPQHHHHQHFAPLPGLSRAISHQNFWFCKHGLVETHERSPFTWGGHPYTSDHGLATDCSNPCLPLYRRPLGGRPASSSGRYGTFCILKMRSTLSKFFFRI